MDRTGIVYLRFKDLITLMLLNMKYLKIYPLLKVNLQNYDSITWTYKSTILMYKLHYLYYIRLIYIYMYLTTKNIHLWCATWTSARRTYMISCNRHKNNCLDCFVYDLWLVRRPAFYQTSTNTHITTFSLIVQLAHDLCTPKI